MQNGGFVNKIQGVRLSVAKIHRHVFENPGCLQKRQTAAFPVLYWIARNDYFPGMKSKKRAFTAPYHFPIIFLSILPYTIWRNPLYFSANCIRLSPNRLYFLAKEPQNKSSYSPECKITPKNTKK